MADAAGNYQSSATVVPFGGSIGRGNPPGPPIEPPFDGGGGSGDLAARVKRLEEDAKEARADIKSISSALSDIKAELKGISTALQSMPTGRQLGHLEGQISSLPTMPKIAALLASVISLALILNNLASIAAWLRAFGKA